MNFELVSLIGIIKIDYSLNFKIYSIFKIKYFTIMVYKLNSLLVNLSQVVDAKTDLN